MNWYEEFIFKVKGAYTYLRNLRAVLNQFLYVANVVWIVVLHCLVIANFSLGQLGSGVSTHGSMFANLSSNAPEIVLWQLKMFRLFPSNCSDFNKAVAEVKLKLQPNESKRFTVYFSVAADGQPIRFMYLHPADQEVLHSANIQRVAEIELTREKYGVARLPVLSEAEFLREVSHRKYHRDYPDYAFTMNAINAINGFSERDATNMKIRGLDEKTRAVADGTVILIASKDCDTYQVFDPETKAVDTQTYTKRETLKEMGNTVWLYVKCKDAEYTVVYSHLEKIGVKLGQSLTQTQEIGSWKSTETNDCSWYVYRVYGAKQAFLRESGGDQKPYCVLPNSVR